MARRAKLVNSCYKPSRRSAAGLLVPARSSVRPRKPRPVATHGDNPIIRSPVL